MLIVFDIDGVLADIDHRVPYIEQNDWEAFNDPKNVAKDRPIFETISLYNALINNPDNTVHIWTGRCASTKVVTLKWLRKYGIPRPRVLEMRPRTTKRTNPDLKRAYIKKHGRPDMVFDAQLSSCQMWQDRNINLMYTIHAEEQENNND